MSLSIINAVPALSINAPEGSPAPYFTLNTLSGEQISLGQLKGEIAAIVYWETGQERSLMALKDLENLYNSYKERGVKIIAVTAEAEHRALILQTVKDAGISFPVLLDPEREVYGSYGIRVYPSTVIIDRDGKFAYSIPGHALSYNVRVESMLRFMLGDIDREQFETVLAFERKKTDETLLRAERRYNLALRFTGARLYEQAMEASRQSIAIKNDFAPPHVLLGFLLLDDGETDAAYTEFMTALDLEPDNAEAATGLGTALLKKGRTDEAIEVLGKSDSDKSRSLMNSYELGKAYYQNGEKEKTLEKFKDILEGIIEKHTLPSAVSKCD